MNISTGRGATLGTVKGIVSVFSFCPFCNSLSLSLSRFCILTTRAPKSEDGKESMEEEEERGEEGGREGVTSSGSTDHYDECPALCQPLPVPWLSVRSTGVGSRQTCFRVHPGPTQASGLGSLHVKYHRSDWEREIR